jgi:hypothetical protein
MKINVDTLLRQSGLAKAASGATPTPEEKAFPKDWFPEQATHLQGPDSTHRGKRFQFEPIAR